MWRARFCAHGLLAVCMSIIICECRRARVVRMLDAIPIEAVACQTKKQRRNTRIAPANHSLHLGTCVVCPSAKEQQTIAPDSKYLSLKLNCT